MKSKFTLFLTLLFSFSLFGTPYEWMPVSYQGRIRPVDAYAKAWLYDFYHAKKMENTSALDLIWEIDLLGTQSLENAPFFWESSADVKKLAGLDLKQNRFSYRTLHNAFYKNREPSQRLMNAFIHYHAIKAFSNQNNERIELADIAPGLWVAKKPQGIFITDIPKGPLWQFLDTSKPLSGANKKVAEDILDLLSKLNRFEKLGVPDSEAEFFKAYEAIKHLPPKQIQQLLEKDFPLVERLRSAGSLLKVLPGRFKSGEWFSLQAFNTHVYSPATNRIELIGNFTLFSDEEFYTIRNSRSKEELSDIIYKAYGRLIGKTAQQAHGKSQLYPTYPQLQAESFYSKYPLNIYAILLYTLALIALILGFRFAPIIVCGAFIYHTFLLLLRSFILGRPPVANMAETVLYVPWIAVGVSLLFYAIWGQRLLLSASSLASIVLLSLLQTTDPIGNLENIQPVLDSQFWLLIHVLMVVGSYGVFILAGVLGHFYLILFATGQRETPFMQKIASSILQSLYLGTALLIVGTILGGVWAAESWGRFWDWDPKESWAFISSCVYLIFIHAYRFNRIGHFGLAMGSIVGLLSISFTWYGVNYILGTGLHSYGFGFGGEIYYLLFIGIELLFLAYVLYLKNIEKYENLV